MRRCTSSLRQLLPVLQRSGPRATLIKRHFFAAFLHLDEISNIESRILKRASMRWLTCMQVELEDMQ